MTTIFVYHICYVEKYYCNKNLKVFKNINGWVSHLTDNPPCHHAYSENKWPETLLGIQIIRSWGSFDVNIGKPAPKEVRAPLSLVWLVHLFEGERN